MSSIVSVPSEYQPRCDSSTMNCVYNLYNVNSFISTLLTLAILILFLAWTFPNLLRVCLFILFLMVGVLSLGQFLGVHSNLNKALDVSGVFFTPAQSSLLRH